MSSPKDQIKERVSIEDCISSYITLVPSGKNFKARCPFHNEKTPSFFVSTERDSFYCFGCGAKGDIFSFVEQFEGVDFRGALKILGDRAGVNINTWKQEKTDDKERLYEIMEKATEYFESEFEKNNDALTYLIERGLSDKTIKYFRIGYAPPSWRSVSTFLENTGFNQEEMLKVGLIKKSEKDNGKSFYDRFRGRIMFPISDSSGRVIAFSGRIFDETQNNKSFEAKYINSTDSVLFNKSNTLFGIDKAKLDIKRKGYSILVEGQLDLLLSHQSGLTNTVALSGTALSSDTGSRDNMLNNLGLVKRLSSNIILAFDGDEAGMRATRRSATIAMSLDMQVKIANILDSRDPADIIKENPEEWKNIIRNAKNIVSFELDKMLKDLSDQKKWGRYIRDTIFPYLNSIKSKIEQSAYLKEIHTKTGIPEQAVHEDFQSYQKTHLIINDKDVVSNSVEDKKMSRLDLLEKQFVSIIFLFENSDNINDKAKKYLKEMESKIGKDVLRKILDAHSVFKEDLVAEAQIWYGDQIDDAERDIDEVIINLEEEIMVNYARDKMMDIRKAENEGEKDKSSKLLKEYQDLINKIEDIKNKRT